MPPRVTIIVDTTDKDNGYNRASDLIEEELRNAPTALIDIPANPGELADIAYYNALVQRMIDRGEI